MADFGASSAPSAAPPSTSPPAEAGTAPPAALPEAEAPICLDFLKGRCSRKRCRFLHPDLSQFQQLSGAVHAQAGRHVCEVWAMTGHCRFGASCSRLHPVVLQQPSQPMMTLYLPVAIVPQSLQATSTEAVAGAIAPSPDTATSSSSPLPASPLVPGPGLSSGPSAFCTSAPAPPSPVVTVPPPSPFLPPAPRPLAPPITVLPPHSQPGPVPTPALLGPAPPLLPPPRPAHPALAALLPPHHVAPPPPAFAQQQDSVLPREGQDPVQSSQSEKRRDPRAIVPISKGSPQVAPETAPGRGMSLACLFGAESVTERPTMDLSSFAAPTPTVDASPSSVPGRRSPVAPRPKPAQKRSHNPHHERDRMFLDMLRDLYNAGC